MTVQLPLDLNNLDPTSPPAPYLGLSDTLMLFDTCSVMGMDTESNGQDVRDGRGFGVGISVAAGHGDFVLSTYLPFRHSLGNNYSEQDLFNLKTRIESYTGALVFHNAKFDLENLSTLGINYRGKFYDTMLMSHLTNENRYSQALDSLSQTLLGDPGKKKSDVFEGYKKVFGWGNIPSYLMFEYAAYDAVLHYRLYNYLKPAFDVEQLDDMWDHKQTFTNLIRKMERWGVRIDVDFCKRMIENGEIAMAEMEELLGLNPGGQKDQYELFINRLQLPVLKRGKPKIDKVTGAELPGRPSFDKFVMEQYEEILQRRSSDSTAQYVLTYRGWQKSVSSNYKAYLDLLSPDGRLRPNYKLHGTHTGRMSCEKPNLQQIPRSSDKPWNGQLKIAFIASTGYTLWEADYSQLELRLGAAYAQETQLLEVFADPERDVFTEMSKQLGMTRFDTKTLTYSMQYGAGVNRIKNVFNVSESKAQEIRNNYFETYPNFKLITQIASQRAVVAGKIKLWSGRYRHFQDRQSEKHKAFNSAIQGGAADIVERTMVRLDNNGCNTDDCRMLLQVHDSVVFEIRDGMEDSYLPKIRECMENVPEDFGVVFKVDVHKWGE